MRSEVMQIRAVDFDPQGTPFRKLNFTLLGDDKGPTFFRIDPSNGRIYVKTDLRPDTEIEYKVSTLWSQGIVSGHCHRVLSQGPVSGHCHRALSQGPVSGHCH